MQETILDKDYPASKIGKVVSPNEIAQVIEQLLSFVNSDDNEVRIKARDKFFSHLYALDFYDNFIETTLGINFHEFEQQYLNDVSTLIPEDIINVIRNYIDQMQPSFEFTPSNIIGSVRGVIRTKVNSLIDSIKGFFRR
jgi:hypothetical protein